jgi:hypothetical protein
MRSMLRRIIALPDVYIARDDLLRQIQRMRAHLKPPIQEYERNFRRIARQGLLDDKVLRVRLDALATSADPAAEPTLPTELGRPSGVGEVLMEPTEFPALAAWLQDFEPHEGEFTASSEIESTYRL